MKGSKYVLGVATDLTALKSKENTLREIEREQRTILDSIPAMIFFKDKQNRLVRVNEFFAKNNWHVKRKHRGSLGFCVRIRPEGRRGLLAG